MRSNVRKFGQTQFRIWRCLSCLSVHAADEVDLAECYRDYPFHRTGKQDDTKWMVNAGYRNLLGRLRKAGFRREHKLLDYGCGGGEFLGYLKQKGYDGVGFDEYSERFADRSVLARKYDFVLSQDVIEHVAEPWEHVRTLAELIVPGGVLALGTPNSEAFDLRNTETCRHALHQPFHRHILSRRALLSIGERYKWQLLHFYTTMYAHTLVPFVNGHYFAYYCKTGDDTIDYVMEPLRLNNLKLYSPAAMIRAFFGYFNTPPDNVMALFRTSPVAALAQAS